MSEPAPDPTNAQAAGRALALLAHAPGLNGRIARLWVNGRTPTQIAVEINTTPGSNLIVTTAAVLTRLREMGVVDPPPDRPTITCF